MRFSATRSGRNGAIHSLPAAPDSSAGYRSCSHRAARLRTPVSERSSMTASRPVAAASSSAPTRVAAATERRVAAGPSASPYWAWLCCQYRASWRSRPAITSPGPLAWLPSMLPERWSSTASSAAAWMTRAGAAGPRKGGWAVDGQLVSSSAAKASIACRKTSCWPGGPVSGPRAIGRSQSARRAPEPSGAAEGSVYAGVSDVFPVVEAFGVDAEQDFDAVPGPLGDLCRGDSGVQPERYRRVAQVVGASGQGRGDLGRGQRAGSGLRPTRR